MIILAYVHWRKINGINFSHYETFTNTCKCILKYDWTISNKLWSLVNTIVEHHCIILMQLLIISCLKSVSRYVSYCEASFAIRIVSWGECIVAALLATLWAQSKHSDQTVWMPRLIRVFIGRMSFCWFCSPRLIIILKQFLACHWLKSNWCCRGIM